MDTTAMFLCKERWQKTTGLIENLLRSCYRANRNSP